MKFQFVGKWEIYTGEIHSTYESFFEKYHALEWKKYWLDEYTPKARKNSKRSHGWEVVFSAPQQGEFTGVDDITRMYLVKKGNHVLVVNNKAFISREDPHAIYWRKIWK